LIDVLTKKTSNTRKINVGEQQRKIESLRKELAGLKLKDIVKNNFVHFNSYRTGFFHYIVKVNNIIYQFPIDREDIGQATLLATDKAIMYMRWIRKAIENGQFVKI